MNTLNGVLSYQEKHKELISVFEHMIALIAQMSEGQYSSLELYVNNCNHFHDRYLEARKILSYKEFENYLMTYDAQLFYHLQSVSLAFKVISNMMSNFNNILKNKADSAGMQ